MKRWRLFSSAILLGLLCACALPQGSPQPPEPGKINLPDQKALPCAESDSGEFVNVHYQAESLYHKGAVLPTEDGLVCLEALAEWVKNKPQQHWQVTVAGEAGYGFDPQALAAKRQQLLARFLSRKGVDLQGWEWRVVADQERQLELQQIKELP